jgi:ParB family transcriptional regulator, chromosome partitioning protein
MGKLDQLMKAGSALARESMGATRSPGLPAGMEGLGGGQSPSMPPHLQGTGKERGALRIAVDRIVADPDQPRTEFDEDELARLAESLRTRGQLQPVRVRWDAGQGAYVLIMGERRWRAARMAGLAELSCIVHEGHLEEGERLALQLIENALRSDLGPVEQAKAYRRLIDAQGWSARQLAAELALAPTTVTRALALLELPAEVQDQVEGGRLGARVAYEVAKLEGGDTQAEVARVVVAQKLNQGEVAELVSAIKAKRPAPAARPDPVAFDLGEASITIRWKKAGPSAVQLLRRALKEAQERERQGEADAA